MPYQSIAELPTTFNRLPAAAKAIALAVVNSSLAAGDDEETAIRKAWGAVKRSYEQRGEEWVKKMEEVVTTQTITTDSTAVGSWTITAAEPLTTEDILGVQLFAVGTWHGVKFDHDDLDAMVKAAQELPLKRPVVIDHDDSQPLLKRSGVPAAGWVENLRRDGDKLLGDLKAVPSKLAALIRAGAYRTRSAEIYRQYIYGDRVYPLVFKALALLGGRIPEVKTLDDIVALYGAGAECVTFEEGDLASYTEGGEEAPTDARTALSELVGAMVLIGTGAPELEAFVATVREAWKGLDDAHDGNDIGGEHVDAAKFASLLHLSEDATEDEVAAKVKELEEAPEKALEEFKASSDYQTLVERAGKAEVAERTLFERERDELFTAAQAEGRMLPAQVEAFTALYEKDPEGVTAIVASLPKLVEFGERGGTGSVQDDSEEAQARAIRQYMKDNKVDYEAAYTAILVGEVD